MSKSYPSDISEQSHSCFHFQDINTVFEIETKSIKKLLIMCMYATNLATVKPFLTLSFWYKSTYTLYYCTTLDSSCHEIWVFLLHIGLSSFFFSFFYCPLLSHIPVVLLLVCTDWLFVKKYFGSKNSHKNQLEVHSQTNMRYCENGTGK